MKFKNLSFRSPWAKLFQWETLSHKMVMGILPAVLCVTVLMGAFGYYLVKRQILAGVQKEVDTLARQASLRLEAFFRQRRNDLESLSETPLIRSYMRNRDFGLEQEAEVYRWELNTHLRNFARRARVYDEIAYIRPDGHRVASSKSMR